MIWRTDKPKKDGNYICIVRVKHDGLTYKPAQYVHLLFGEWRVKDGEVEKWLDEYWDEDSKKDDELDKLYNLNHAQQKYIELLGEEIGDLSSIASIHGWVTSRAELGEKYRADIEECKKSLSRKREPKR